MENIKFDLNFNLRISIGENTLAFLREVLTGKEIVAKATKTLNAASSKLQSAVRDQSPK